MNAHKLLHITSGLFFLTGCASDAGSEMPSTDLKSLIVHEELKEDCINTFKDRISNSMASAKLDGDRDSILLGVLDNLGPSERNPFIRTARKIISHSGGSYQNYPSEKVMYLLAEEFEKIGACRFGGAEYDAYIFVDQLNVYLLDRGVDTDRFIYSNSDSQSAPMNLGVALVLKLAQDLP